MKPLKVAKHLGSDLLGSWPGDSFFLSRSPGLTQADSGFTPVHLFEDPAREAE
jgi:hypothetical protein